MTETPEMPKAARPMMTRYFFTNISELVGRGGLLSSID